MIIRFFVASFIFIIAFVYDCINGQMNWKTFKYAWPMYPRYVKFGYWIKEGE